MNGGRLKSTPIRFLPVVICLPQPLYTVRVITHHWRETMTTVLDTGYFRSLLRATHEHFLAERALSNEWVILGVTVTGEVFDVPDWPERLCGMLATQLRDKRTLFRLSPSGSYQRSRRRGDVAETGAGQSRILRHREAIRY
jgi:hypothetical protein